MKLKKHPYNPEYAINFKVISKYRRVKSRDRFDRRFHQTAYYRKCQFCGKTRRAGYIFGCPNCYIYREIAFQLRGLSEYMAKQGISLKWDMSNKNVAIQTTVLTTNGLQYTATDTLTVKEIKEHTQTKPLEELFAKVIANQCGFSFKGD